MLYKSYKRTHIITIKSLLIVDINNQGPFRGSNIANLQLVEVSSSDEHFYQLNTFQRCEDKVRADDLIRNKDSLNINEQFFIISQCPLILHFLGRNIKHNMASQLFIGIYMLVAGFCLANGKTISKGKLKIGTNFQIYAKGINVFTLIGYKNAFSFLETEARHQREMDSPDCEDCNRKCGGIIDSPGQNIRSLNTTSDLYDPNLECLWLIELDRRSQIRLTITEFELESGTAKMCPSCDDATCP